MIFSSTLGQRVVLMAAGPGRIQRVIPIDLPYPRARDAFARCRRELYGEFHLVHQEAAPGGGGNGSAG